MSSQNVSINTVALVRAMLPKDASGVVPVVVRRDGHARCGSRLEVVRKDPSGSFTWTELHLGLVTKAGKLDFSSFPRKNADIGGYTRRVGKRQVIRTAESLMPWQESNLRYAQGRIERAAHDEVKAFETTPYVEAREHQVTRRTPRGDVIQVNWMPEMLRGEFRKEIVMNLGLDPKISDAELINEVGGDAEKGIIPACLLREVIPEAVLLDLRDFTGWVAVDASTIPGLLALEAFDIRELEIAQKRDLKRNGLQVRPEKTEDSTPVTEESQVEAASAVEETQG